MMHPDDLKIGDIITILDGGGKKKFDNWKGAALLVRSIQLPYVVVTHYGLPHLKTPITLDIRRCKIRRVDAQFMRAQLADDELFFFAMYERTNDLKSLDLERDSIKES
jgi:hypothetical protein